MSAVAPPPAPLVVTAPSMEPRPGPPPRAALDVLPPGRPSTELVPPVARFAEDPAVAGDTAKPDVDDDGDGDSDVALVAELTNPTIATDLAAFIAKLGTAGQWIGISAFILFILAFGIQVNISANTEEYNPLHMHHRYWDTDLTNAYIPRTPKYLAIACQIGAIGHDTEICNIDDYSMSSMHH